MIVLISQLKKEGRLFVNKKKPKNFDLAGALAPPLPQPPGAKVFCFFFSKKKHLL
jgi:hypothetical protein